MRNPFILREPDDIVCGNEGINGKLVNPTLRATINTPDNSLSPMIGALDAYPCQANNSYAIPFGQQTPVLTNHYP